jgi:hypothetical protein
VGVSGGEHPAPEALQLGMGEDRLHQPFSPAASTVRLENEHVGEESEGGPLGHHTRESHRVLNRTLDLEGNIGSPLRVLQEVVDGFRVQM